MAGCGAAHLAQLRRAVLGRHLHLGEFGVTAAAEERHLHLRVVLAAEEDRRAERHRRRRHVGVEGFLLRLDLGRLLLQRGWAIRK